MRSARSVGRLAAASSDRVRAGEPVWYLVPDGVVQYVSKRNLYQHQTPDPGASASPQEDLPA